MFQLGFLLVFIFILQANSIELKSSDFLCAGSYAYLECPSDSKIVVEKIIYKYSPNKCEETESSGNYSLEHCVGVVQSDDLIRGACNGETICHFRINEVKFDDPKVMNTNCAFTSNLGNVLYTCLPNFQTQKFNFDSFDICDKYGPEVIQGIDNGFIHSPNYPDYYSNNRNCYIKISIPEDKRLVVYLVQRSLEGKGIFNSRPKDFISFSSTTTFYYGYSNTPEVIYDGNDKEQFEIVFRSDWITSQSLNGPKGFLVFFELFPLLQPEIATTEEIVTTTTTEETTTTSTTTMSTYALPLTSTELVIEDETTKIIDLVKKEEILNSISEKIRNHERETRDEERLVTVITLLIGLIGVLILIIFGLLLMFRRKQKQQNEEDVIYDTNDNKSISSSNYNEEYQNVSVISALSYNKDLNRDANKIGNRKSVKSKKNQPTFSDRLKRLYKNLNQTLNNSTQLVTKENVNELKSEILNNHKKLNDSIDLEKSKSYKINEFNPNDVDIKFEKDIPIDKLKLFRTPSINKKCNLEREQELEQERRREKDNLNRSENNYVSCPILKTSPPDIPVGKLEIYEVNFENNFAYLTPGQIDTNKSHDDSVLSYENDETEIYQSINELENDDGKKLIQNDHNYNISLGESKTSQTISKPSFNVEDIYSTPTNNKVGSLDKLNESTETSNDNSVLNLLNNDDNNNETQA